MFEKVKTKKVYMKIVEQIRDLIREGKLKPGDKLPPENNLAAEFGASRPSVREALSALEILGVIESRGGKGNFISDSLGSPFYKQRFEELEEEESPSELLEARESLETEIAELAAKKATKEDIDVLQNSLNKLKSATNISEFMEFDWKFHVSIAKAAHNKLLLSMMIYLADGLKETLWTNLKKKSLNIPGHTQRRLKEHTEIFNAIKNKDSKGAHEKMYSHLIDVGKDFFGG